MDKKARGYEEQPLFYKGRPVFGRLRTPYFDRIPKEYFKDESCFIFLDEGNMNVRTQQDLIGLNADNAILGKCMNYFFETTAANRREGGMIQMTAVLLFPAIVEELFEFNITDSSYTLNYNVKQVVVNKLLKNFRDSLDILFDNPELADDEMIRNKLKEFVLIVSKSENAPSHLDFLSALFKPANVEFKSTIKQNLYSNLSIDELARLCHLSTSSFKRKFAEVFNESPKKYIVRKKLERAAKLLRSTELRISEIAYDCGFDTISTFNRSFRAQYGNSPSDHRLTQTA